MSLCYKEPNKKYCVLSADAGVFLAAVVWSFLLWGTVTIHYCQFSKDKDWQLIKTIPCNVKSSPLMINSWSQFTDGKKIHIVSVASNQNLQSFATPIQYLDTVKKCSRIKLEADCIFFLFYTLFIEGGTFLERRICFTHRLIEKCRCLC